MKKMLAEVVKGKEVELPVYDFKTHTRYSRLNIALVSNYTCRSKTEKKMVYRADVVLIEGILILYDREIRDMMQMKLFVDTDSDTRLARRGECLTVA